MTRTVICMKWGTRYGADYANRLYSMCRRHITGDLRLICFTDDATGLRPEITARPLPPITLPALQSTQGWRKVSLWNKTLDGLSGPVLFLDLDVIITNSLDVFFEYRPEVTFCVANNWTQPGSGIGNTSVYRFEVGAHSYLFDRLMADVMGMVAKYRNSQTFISREIKEIEFWPPEWCVSFKHSLIPAWPLNLLVAPKLPPETRVVAFTGKPDPDEAELGIWVAPWYKKIYKQVRKAPWISEHWR